MELRHLRYFLATVDRGSVTAAAHSLRIAQSGVSSQLAKLERELGLTLFERVGRGIALTVEGRALLPTIRSAVFAADAVVSRASDLRGLVVGSLRVGTVTSLTWPELFDAIAALHADHPGVDLTLSEATSYELVDGVRRGTLDVAIAAWGGEPPRDLESTVIVDDALVAVVGPSHPWARRSHLNPADLVVRDVIALPPGTGSRDALDAMMLRASDVIAPRWEVAAASSIEALVLRGLGVGVVSESTASDWNLHRIPFSDRAARSQLGIVWRPAPSPAARAFLDRLRH